MRCLATSVVAVACLLVAASTGVDASLTAGATGAAAVTGNFSQYRSKIYQYQGAIGIADWTEAPFGGVINQTRYDAQCDCFLMLIQGGDGSVTLRAMGDYDSESPVISDGLWSSASGPCRLTPLVNGATWIVCGVPQYGRMTTASVAFQQGAWAIAAGPALVFPYENGNVLLDVAAIAGSSPATPTVLLGASAGLFKCPIAVSGLASANCTKVPMINATGGLSTEHNVARIFCLNDVATTSDDFFGGRCFAVSRNNVCTSNLCPADLVHVLNATIDHKRFIRIPGVIDAWPQGIAYDVVDDAIHFADSAAVNSFHRNGTLHRVGGVHAGLPQKNLTAASAGAHGPWFGSKYGAMLRMAETGSWKYFYGPRWLPGKEAAPTPAMHVTDLSTSTSGTALIATYTGFSVIRRQVWTLEDKAAHMQAQEPLFWHFNLAPASVPLREWGVPASGYISDNANEGLWTSMYLASQIFRYASTGDPEAKANCWTSFEGIRSLCTVTGIRGLCARELSNVSHEGQHQWYPSPTMPGWWFNGDPSSDEVTGHLHVYPLMHDLVAETAAERELVVGVIKNITGNIVDNGLILHTITGVPTVWGRWNPGTINNDPVWYDERGLNSLQILGFLSSAYRLTGNATYADIFNDLVDNHGYGENLVNLKITQPSDIDFSDDELTFLAYMCMQWSSRPSAFLPSGNPLWTKVEAHFKSSIERTYKYVHRERPDLWAAIYLMGFGGTNSTPSAAPHAAEAVGDLRWCLETWPTSVVPWPTNNSARLDVHYSPYPNRNGWMHTLLTTMLPYDELSLLVWNSDPFRKWNGRGDSISNPAFYLYPYWLSRWLGVV